VPIRDPDWPLKLAATIREGLEPEMFVHDSPEAQTKRAIGKALRDLYDQTGSFESFTELRHALIAQLRERRLPATPSLVDEQLRVFAQEVVDTRRRPGGDARPPLIVDPVKPPPPEPPPDPEPITHAQAAALLGEYDIDLRGNHVDRRATPTQGAGRPEHFPELVEVPQW
jgi:hypothetical protein